MRIAVLSDIHANLIALEAVLAQVDQLAPDALWCLGDTVGYGPEPQACADLMQERADICLCGNHDLAAIGTLSLDRFNDIAATAAAWHSEHLGTDAAEWLGDLPLKEKAEGITLVHGSPRDPIWEYVTGESVVGNNLDAFDTALCLMGHSHRAMGWRIKEDAWLGRIKMVVQPAGIPLALDEHVRYMLNPGSVGQPRDRDPRAAFALLDTDEMAWTWHRVEYDIETVEHAIAAAGLPEILGRRLYGGW